MLTQYPTIRCKATVIVSITVANRTNAKWVAIQQTEIIHDLSAQRAKINFDLTRVTSVGFKLSYRLVRTLKATVFAIEVLRWLQHKFRGINENDTQVHWVVTGRQLVMKEMKEMSPLA